MSGICDTCKRSNVCRKPLDGMDSCRLYVSGKESNYQRLFGTPERAAETLAAIETCCNIDWDCDKCPLDGVMPSCVFCGADESFKSATIEWLRGDAE